ncbi:MAG: LysR family transcriptional regulator [Acetobacteraceae bacterium]|nr:LysR family transcriptional regulator [Acetobacteraceae bacterium]
MKVSLMENMPDWDDLRIFLAIARHRTLSAAARVLGVQQPTMGRRLAALECRLGTKLLTRTPSGYVLTKEGEAVLGNVERIEAEALSVARQIAGADIRLEGIIRLTTVESLAALVLSPVLAKFRRSHPLVELELVANPRALSLIKREADVALRVARFEQADIVARKVGRIGYGLYAAQSYLDCHGMPNWRQGAAGQDLLLTEADYLHTPEMAWLRGIAPQARVSLSCNSRLMQLYAARAGMGLACLSCHIADEVPELVRLDPPPNASPLPKRDLWLGTHADLRHTPRIRAFMDAVVEGLHAASERLDPE